MEHREQKEVNELGSSRGLANLILDEPPEDIMEDTEKVERIERATLDLKQLAGELRANAVKSRRLMLAAIELLLAGSDLLGEDAIEHLEDEKRAFAGDAQEAGPKEDHLDGAVCEDDEVEVEAVVPSETVIDLYMDAIERALQPSNADDHKAILQVYIDRRLPEVREKEIEEDRRQTATDELLNEVLRDVPTKAFVLLVKRLKENPDVLRASA